MWWFPRHTFLFEARDPVSPLIIHGERADAFLFIAHSMPPSLYVGVRAEASPVVRVPRLSSPDGKPDYPPQQTHQTRRSSLLWSSLVPILTYKDYPQRGMEILGSN